MSRSTAERSFPQLLGDGSVVAAADRFGALARARRRRLLGGLAVAVLCLLAAGWILTASPWGTVRRVQVTGVDRIDPAQVRALATEELGRPLLLVRTGAVETRVRTLRLVADVSVEQVWPGTLRIVVRERQPVAALPAGGGFRLVDRDGVEVVTVGSAPSSVPVVQVDLVTAGPAAVRSALDSLGVLPPALRAQLREVGAASGDGVWFRLDDGDTVVWGDAGQVDLKVAALDALRRQAVRERAAMRKKGNIQLSKRPVTFDVSAPRAPSVQR
jgi:cell division protein FtsQ